MIQPVRNCTLRSVRGQRKGPQPNAAVAGRVVGGQLQVAAAEEPGDPAVRAAEVEDEDARVVLQGLDEQEIERETLALRQSPRGRAYGRRRRETGRSETASATGFRGWRAPRGQDARCAARRSAGRRSAPGTPPRPPTQTRIGPVVSEVAPAVGRTTPGAGRSLRGSPSRRAPRRCEGCHRRGVRSVQGRRASAMVSARSPYATPSVSSSTSASPKRPDSTSAALSTIADAVPSVSCTWAIIEYRLEK